MLSSQGNGIVASNSVKKADLGLNTKGDGKFFKEFETKNKRKFRAAYTFPKTNQEMWIRYWLAAGGVDPDKNVELLTVPAAETVAGLRNCQPGNQSPDGTPVLEQPPGRDLLSLQEPHAVVPAGVDALEVLSGLSADSEN
jgi:hypothetical protein